MALDAKVGEGTRERRNKGNKEQGTLDSGGEEKKHLMRGIFDAGGKFFYLSLQIHGLPYRSIYHFVSNSISVGWPWTCVFNLC